MMKMRAVSRFFDRTPVTDPATGELLFKAQFANYDGSKRDAYSAYRRIMSTDPDITVPASRCVSALGKTWVLGDDQPDGWSELHRVKYIAHMAAGVASVQSLSDYLLGTAATTTWGDIQWISDAAEESISSGVPSMYLAILPDSFEAEQYDLVTVGALTIFVQSAAHQASGFLEARGYVQSAGLPNLSVSVQRRVFNPSTGGYTSSTTDTVRTLQLRWQELFRYTDQMDEKFQEGDVVFAVPLTTDVKMGDELTYGTKTYLLRGITAMAGVRVLHAREKV